MNIKHKDLLFGFQKETELKQTIEKHFNCDFDHTDKYHPYDFINKDKKIMVELKSRNNSYSKYPTTMIGMNKIKYGMESDYTCYFLFNFTDGLYYYKLSDKTIVECDISKGGRKDRGRLEYNQYLFIPTVLLTQISSCDIDR